MASIQKTTKGYRAQIKTKGVRDSQVFPTRREALLWASVREREIIEDKKPEGEKVHTLGQMLTRYSEEESPKKKGQRWEQVRIAAFKKYLLPLDKDVREVTATDIALFRDSRLKSVSESSVKREIAVISAAFQVARMEWKWVTYNPCFDVRKPPKGRHRDRLIEWHEVKKILRQSGYISGQQVASTYQAVGLCFLLALRTGMRAGELCSLTWRNVQGDHCILPDTKNGEKRLVPLSSRAQRVLKLLDGYSEDKVFNLTPETLDVVFRRFRGRQKLSGFTFHDSRHTAATMLAKKVDVLELCKIFGWKQTNQALTYFNPKVSALAAKLG
ncbi:site-specific integrase [Alcaligenaceae bacterium]|nr:site-specific integrase [Alcaligenaceae bacterium]